MSDGKHQRNNQRTYKFPVREPINSGSLAQGFQDTSPLPIIFKAPIDLALGDICSVRITDGQLYEVHRKDKIVFSYQPR
jgi:hypothetical protein